MEIAVSERVLWRSQAVAYVWTGRLKSETCMGGALRVSGDAQSLVQVQSPYFGKGRGLKALANEGRFVPVPLVLLGKGGAKKGVKISLIVSTQGARVAKSLVCRGVIDTAGRFFSSNEEIPALMLPAMCRVEAAIRVTSLEAKDLLLKAKEEPFGFAAAVMKGI